MTDDLAQARRARAEKAAVTIEHNYHISSTAEIAAVIDAALLAHEREVLEHVASYVASHYPVQVLRGGRRAWQMDNDCDGGKVQAVYAEAIRALAGERQ